MPLLLDLQERETGDDDQRRDPDRSEETKSKPHEWLVQKTSGNTMILEGIHLVKLGSGPRA